MNDPPIDNCLPRIADVVENDMCIACGACVQACPNNAVTPTFNDGRGAYEVQITDPSQCEGCPAPCDAVCPSLSVNFAQLSDSCSSPQQFDRQGPITGMYVGYSPLFQKDGVSSSGGVLRGLIRAALEDGFPVICLTKSGEGYEPDILQTPEDLARVPGSIYHSVSFAQGIELLRQVTRPCYLVATPCQLAGILNYVKQCEPALQDKIHIKLGLICGWMYSHHALSAFATFKGLPGQVVDARYRGEDKVGQLKLTTAEQEYQFDRRNFENAKERIDFTSSFSLPVNRLRCRVCEDHLNLLADIAVGDAWLKRTGKEKLSLVVARTSRGDDRLQELVRRQILILEDAEAGDLVESQSENLVYGLGARKLNRYLGVRNKPVPRFVFDAESEPVRVGWWDWFEFKLEFWLRSLVRSGRYLAYRRVYIFYKYLRLLRGGVQRRWKLWRKKSN